MDCSGIIDTAPFERKGKACHQGRQPIATARTAFKKSTCVPLLPQVLQDGTTTGLVRIFPLAYKRAFKCTRTRLRWHTNELSNVHVRGFTGVRPYARFRQLGSSRGIPSRLSVRSQEGPLRKPNRFEFGRRCTRHIQRNIVWQRRYPYIPNFALCERRHIAPLEVPQHNRKQHPCVGNTKRFSCKMMTIRRP